MKLMYSKPKAPLVKKRVLLISYYFPPLGMGGTQRVAGFARHLPKFDWQPTVLTVKPIYYYAHDDELLAGLERCEIVRTGSLDPARVMQKLREALAGSGTETGSSPARGARSSLLRLLNFLTIPDNKILWLPFAARAATKLLRKQSFDMLLSSGPPHSTHLLVRRLSRRCNLPWVADLRDRWANGDFQPNPTGLHRRADRALQSRCLAHAAHIVAVSEGLAETLRHTLPREKRGRVSVITNGFEAVDFRDISEQKPERFDIVHAGTIGNYVHPETILFAYKQFLEETGLPPAGTQMIFIGADLSGKFHEAIRALKLDEYVQISGYKRHSEAVRAISMAQVLLYLVSGAGYSGFIPGKTFEYLAAGRPVLALADETEGLRILQKYSRVRHVAPQDLAGTVLALKAFYLEFTRGRTRRRVPESINEFTREQLTGRLAEIFATIGKN